MLFTFDDDQAVPGGDDAAPAEDPMGGAPAEGGDDAAPASDPMSAPAEGGAEEAPTDGMGGEAGGDDAPAASM